MWIKACSSHSRVCAESNFNSNLIVHLLKDLSIVLIFYLIAWTSMDWGNDIEFEHTAMDSTSWASSNSSIGSDRVGSVRKRGKEKGQWVLVGGRCRSWSVERRSSDDQWREKRDVSVLSMTDDSTIVLLISLSCVCVFILVLFCIVVDLPVDHVVSFSSLDSFVFIESIDFIEIVATISNSNLA